MSQATAPILDFEPPEFIPESELIDSDGVPLDSAWHRKQINLTDLKARRRVRAAHVLSSQV